MFMYNGLSIMNLFTEKFHEKYIMIGQNNIYNNLFYTHFPFTEMCFNCNKRLWFTYQYSMHSSLYHGTCVYFAAYSYTGSSKLNYLLLAVDLGVFSHLMINYRSCDLCSVCHLTKQNAS